MKHDGLRGLTHYQRKYKYVKQSLSDLLRESSDSGGRLKAGSRGVFKEEVGTRRAPPLTLEKI